MRLGLAASAATMGGVADSTVLLEAAAANGVQARLIDWRGPGWDWPQLVLLHTPWDYTADVREFTAWVRAQSARTPVLNPPSVVEGNVHKSYLLELLAAGVPAPTTRLLHAGQSVDQDDLRSAFADAAVVAKPAVGSGGRRMSRLSDVAALGSFALVSDAGVVLEDLLVQEFLPAVHTFGEHSLIVVAGQVSHVIHKVASPGEFRVQASHGGSEHLVDPDDATADVARIVLPLLTDVAYARIDYVLDPQRGPLVMELELTEPDLFLRHEPAAAHRLIAHVVG